MEQEYKFIAFFNQDVEWDGTNDEEISTELNKLIEECEFLLAEGNSLYATKDIAGTESNFRGPCVRLGSGFLYTQYYHIMGGFKLITKEP